MEITKTFIRARLLTLVTDREYCMEHGLLNKSMDLVSACTTLRKELSWTLRHGHNAHTALVRRNAVIIWKLANTLGRKAALREEIQSMVLTLTNQPAGNPVIHTKPVTA